MAIEIRILNEGDEAVLTNVAPDVFDDPIDMPATEVFLADDRHHIAVAVEDGLVVGFASAFHYAHPDKTRADLFINEVGVSPDWQGRGIGKALVEAMLTIGRDLGCRQAWVATEEPNTPAIRLYASTGGEEAPDKIVMFTYSLVQDGDAREPS